MNAESLYEIVKDVPKAAWVDGVFYTFEGPGHCWQFWPNESEDAIPVTLHPHHAALMFTGAMVGWLLERGVSVRHIPGVRQFWTVRTSQYEKCVSPSSPTLLEALAAACREVK